MAPSIPDSKPSAGWSKVSEEEAAEMRADVLREAADSLEEGDHLCAAADLREMASEGGAR